VSEPRLIVVTGPSHAGKSSVLTVLREQLDGPVAVLAMDDVLGQLTIPPAEDYWRVALEAGYDVLLASAEALLRRGFTVLLESTFTFVPLDDAPPELHARRIAELADVAVATGSDFDLVLLTATLPELIRRRGATKRLWDRVVEGSHQLHETFPGDGVQIRVDTTGQTPAAVAERLRRQLSREGGRGSR